MTKRIPLAVALAAFAMACSDPTMPTRTLVGSGPSLLVTSENYAFPSPAFPEGMLPGQVRLCKTVAASASVPATSFNFTVSATGTGTLLNAAPTLNIPAGGGTACTIVYRSLENGPLTQIDNVVITEGANPSANWSLTAINTRRLLVQSIT